jgi:hypothetical protein
MSTMNDDDRDERLSRMLRAVRADADPVLWTRVRARIEERERVAPRGWLAWVMRPAALGGSLAVLALALVATFTLVSTAPWSTTGSAAETLEDALVGEIETHAGDVRPTTGAPAPVTTTDSGASR